MSVTIHRGGQNYGPFTLEQINEYLRDGTFNEGDLAWYGDCIEWKAVGDFLAYSSLLPKTKALPPPPSFQAHSLPQNEFKYLKPYYQDKFREIEESDEQRKAGWNWAAFFFTWIWAYTKGTNKNATLCLVLHFICLAVFAGIPTAVFMLYYGIRGNWLYYNKIKHNKSLWL